MPKKAGMHTVIKGFIGGGKFWPSNQCALGLGRGGEV